MYIIHRAPISPKRWSGDLTQIALQRSVRQLIGWWWRQASSAIQSILSLTARCRPQHSAPRKAQAECLVPLYKLTFLFFSKKYSWVCDTLIMRAHVFNVSCTFSHLEKTHDRGWFVRIKLTVRFVQSHLFTSPSLSTSKNLCMSAFRFSLTNTPTCAHVQDALAHCYCCPRSHGAHAALSHLHAPSPFCSHYASGLRTSFGRSRWHRTSTRLLLLAIARHSCHALARARSFALALLSQMFALPRICAPHHRRSVCLRARSHFPHVYIHGAHRSRLQ